MIGYRSSRTAQLGLRHQPLLTCQRLDRENVHVHCPVLPGPAIQVPGGCDAFLCRPTQHFLRTNYGDLSRACDGEGFSRVDTDQAGSLPNVLRSVLRGAKPQLYWLLRRIDRGISSRMGPGVIGCREKRDSGEEPLRQGLETWILFSPSIVECAVQAMRHGSLSSKIQTAVADLFDRMWTSERGAVRIMLYGMSIEYEAPVDGSCTRTCLLTWDECLGSGDRWTLECGGRGVGF